MDHLSGRKREPRRVQARDVQMIGKNDYETTTIMFGRPSIVTTGFMMRLHEVIVTLSN